MRQRNGSMVWRTSFTKTKASWRRGHAKPLEPSLNSSYVPTASRMLTLRTSSRLVIGRTADNPPLERTAAAVYFTCGRASRVRRRGRSTALRYAPRCAHYRLYVPRLGHSRRVDQLLHQFRSLPTASLARRIPSRFPLDLRLSARRLVVSLAGRLMSDVPADTDVDGDHHLPLRYRRAPLVCDHDDLHVA